MKIPVMKITAYLYVKNELNPNMITEFQYARRVKIVVTLFRFVLFITN